MALELTLMTLSVSTMTMPQESCALAKQRSSAAEASYGKLSELDQLFSK